MTTSSSKFEASKQLVTADKANFLADEVGACAGDLTLKSGSVYVRDYEKELTWNNAGGTVAEEILLADIFTAATPSTCAIAECKIFSADDGAYAAADGIFSVSVPTKISVSVSAVFAGKTLWVMCRNPTALFVEAP